MSELNTLFKPQISSVMSNMVRDNAFRLDAGAYSPDNISIQLLRGGNLKSKKLSDIADVFGFGPFKRTYIADPTFGLPLLSSSEIMATNPSPNILAKFNCPKWSQYGVREGWIVISCSGTIGNVAIIPKKLNQWALSQHTIRIIPEKGCFRTRSVRKKVYKKVPFTLRVVIQQFLSSSTYWRNKPEEKLMKRLASYEVLLIDEIGYISCKKEQASLFFDLMRRRHKQKTTIITTPLGFDEWGDFLHDSHLTAALLDRITVNCTVFNMKDCISIRPKKIVYATSKRTAQDPDESLDGEYVDE